MVVAELQPLFVGCAGRSCGEFALPAAAAAATSFAAHDADWAADHGASLCGHEASQEFAAHASGAGGHEAHDNFFAGGPGLSTLRLGPGHGVARYASVQGAAALSFAEAAQGFLIPAPGGLHSAGREPLRLTPELLAERQTQLRVAMGISGATFFGAVGMGVSFVAKLASKHMREELEAEKAAAQEEAAHEADEGAGESIEHRRGPRPSFAGTGVRVAVQKPIYSNTQEIGPLADEADAAYY